MTFKDVLLNGSGLFIIFMTLVQISPIKINPWSFIAEYISNRLNSNVMKELKIVKDIQIEQSAILANHIKTDDARNADNYRGKILQFNTEILRGIKHTKEDFNEVMLIIDKYNAYCRANPEYPNERATHAVTNILRVYDKCVEERDFL